jgi:cell shape-determining protein MreD
MGDWFKSYESEIAREHFIIPLIAVAFLVYSFMLSYFYVIYVKYYKEKSQFATALRFGIIMGIIWDALQGGIIETATFKIPFIVFVVDSGYHVLVEGSIAGLILYFVSKKWSVHSK